MPPTSWASMPAGCSADRAAYAQGRVRLGLGAQRVGLKHRFDWARAAAFFWKVGSAFSAAMSTPPMWFHIITHTST
eukprot:7219766-Prymnesium_polylepis.1